MAMDGQAMADYAGRIAYVAGPYRGKTVPERWANITAARAVALELWRAGCVVICPHMNTANFDGLCPDEVWLKGALEIMRRCDFVVLAPGWARSEGTLAEVEEAKRLGMDIVDWGDREFSLPDLGDDVLVHGELNSEDAAAWRRRAEHAESSLRALALWSGKLRAELDGPVATLARAVASATPVSMASGDDGGDLDDHLEEAAAARDLAENAMLNAIDKAQRMEHERDGALTALGRVRDFADRALSPAHDLDDVRSFLRSIMGTATAAIADKPATCKQAGSDTLPSEQDLCPWCGLGPGRQVPSGGYVGGMEIQETEWPCGSRPERQSKSCTRMERDRLRHEVEGLRCLRESVVTALGSDWKGGIERGNAKFVRTVKERDAARAALRPLVERMRALLDGDLCDCEGVHVCGRERAIAECDAADAALAQQPAAGRAETERAVVDIAMRRFRAIKDGAPTGVTWPLLVELQDACARLAALEQQVGSEKAAIS